MQCSHHGASLVVLQGHEDPPSHGRQNDALPNHLPAQDFLCQQDVEEVDRAARAAASQVREPHPPGLACAQSESPACQPCLMLLALHLVVMVPPTSGQGTGVIWQHTDALAVVPTWLCLVLCPTSSTRKIQRSAAQCSISCLWTCRLTLHLYRSRAESHLLQHGVDAAQHRQGLPLAVLLLVRLSNSAFPSMFLTLLQELGSLPITLGNESSETGGGAGADDALLSILLLVFLNHAAQVRPEERQHVPTPDNKAGEQFWQSTPAWRPRRAASLHLR